MSRIVANWYTVCPGSSDPPEKKNIDICASENEVYTIYYLLQYFRLNISRLQSKIILGHVNYIGYNSSIRYVRLGNYFLDIKYNASV